MRWETPWSASSGTTTSASTSARPISAAVTVARPGRLRIAGHAFNAAPSLGDDVLEGRPREYREDRVVEREEQQVAVRFRGDRRAHSAHDKRDRQREQEERQQELACA